MASVSSSTRGRIVTLAFCIAQAEPTATIGRRGRVITRALDSMGKLGLVTRRRDETDKRNVVIQRTVAGALAVEHLADLVTARARELGPA